MSLPVASIKRLLFAPAVWTGREGLVVRRLFWGALSGCVMAALLGQLPLLESPELSTLKWRYQIANRLAARGSRPCLSPDIAIVAFDDTSQYDLGLARFDDNQSQAVLSQALSVIERGSPALVAVDLDLRGASSPGLIQLLRRHRNIVIALFGSLESGSDQAEAEFMAQAAACGHNELIRESDGTVLKLPLGRQLVANTAGVGLATVPSLTQAILGLCPDIAGKLRIDRQLNDPQQSLYINFRQVQYPVIPLQAVLSPGFDPLLLKGRVVLVGATLTSRQDDPLRCQTPLNKAAPEVVVQADTLSTWLHGGPIVGLNKNRALYLLLAVGALFGAVLGALPTGKRAALLLGGIVVSLLVSQFSFQALHLVIPLAPLLAVLIAAFVLGTVIYLDTDLRESNRELAEAKLDMQERAERERQRIAEDLHDETLPALSVVARMADQLSQDLGSNPVPLQMRQKLDNAVSEMRRVINDLHPSVLETMGFVPALENLAACMMRESGIAVHFEDASEKGGYDPPAFAQLQLYRMVQEALNNIVRHAQATRARVEIRGHREGLLISIADDGRGFDPQAIKRDSHGLMNMRQRAQLIGAQVRWRRPKIFPSGTQVCIEIADEGKKHDHIDSRR